MKSVDKEYITKEELCQILNISEKTAYNLLKSGKFHFDKSTTGRGHHYEIPLKEVLEYKQYRDERYILEGESLKKFLNYYSQKLNEYPSVISAKEIHNFTGYGKETIRNWIVKGLIVGVLVRKQYKVAKQDLIDFLISPYFLGITRKSAIHKQDIHNIGILL